MADLDAAQLAARLAGGTPRQRLLLQLLRQSQSAGRMGPEAETSPRRQAPDRRKERALEFLTLQNQALAAACGACTCWGHPRCRICRGEGGSGWRDPDPEMFRRFIEPVLYRLGLVAPCEEPVTAAQPRSQGEADHA